MSKKNPTPKEIREEWYHKRAADVIDDIEVEFKQNNDESDPHYGDWKAIYKYQQEVIYTKYFLVKVNKKTALMMIKPLLMLGEVHQKIFELLKTKGERMEKLYGHKETKQKGQPKYA